MPRALRDRCEPWRSSQTTNVGWLSGACIAARRETLLELGPFDERIHLFAEDLDLGLRAHAAGVASLYAPDVARVVHLGDRSAARRYSDAGLAQSIVNRRKVVQWRRGRIREIYDFGAQVLYHALRFGAKLVLRIDSSRERQWLTTVARLPRHRPAH